MSRSTAATTDAQLLRAIVRGEGSWRELTRFGIEPGLDQSPATWRNPKSNPMVQVNPQDVAAGLLTHLSSPPALRAWAQAIEMRGCFDLTPLESGRDGGAPLTAIWLAPFGQAIDDETLRSVRTIARRPSLRRARAVVDRGTNAGNWI